MDFEIKTIEEYLNTILLLQAQEKSTLWFRGQNRSYYNLQPSLLRHSIQVANQFGTPLKVETPDFRFSHGQTVLIPPVPKLLEDFKTYCNNNNVTIGNPCNDMEWYFLAQHYGLPTTLLDWTEDPMIALFFAINKCDYSDTNVNIFICSPNNLNNNLTHGILNETFNEPMQVEKNSLPFLLKYISYDNMPYLPICVKPTLQNYRILRQSGNFILHGCNFQPLDLQPFSNFFHHLSIPRKFFSYFEKILSSLQISEFTVYGNKTPLDEAIKQIRHEVLQLFYNNINKLQKNLQ